MANCFAIASQNEKASFSFARFCLAYEPGGIAAFGGGSSRSELQIKEFKPLLCNGKLLRNSQSKSFAK
jgi:hypothetical protein